MQIEFKKPNYDTLTLQSESSTTSKLLKYLDYQNPDASEYVKYLLSKDRHSEISKKTDTSRLEILDTKILEVLKKIEANMIDEQDTSIKYKNSQFSKISATSNPSEQISETQTDHEQGDFDLEFDRRKGRPKNSKDHKKRTRRSSKKASEIQERKKSDSRISERTEKQTSPKKASEIQEKKLETKTPKVEKELKTAKKAGKVVGKAAKAGLRSALASTGIGLLADAVFALSDMAEGYMAASENLGIDEENLTVGNKVASSLGGLASGLTLGLVDEDYLAQGINNALGGNSTIKKYESSGILQHNSFGDSKILDWDAIRELPKSEIQKIIEIDDWSKKDKQKLEKIRDSNNIKSDKKFSEENTEKVSQIDPKQTVSELDNLGIIQTSLLGDSKILDWDAILALPENGVDKLIEHNDWDKKTESRLKEIKSIAKGVDAFKQNITTLTKQEQINAVQTKINIASESLSKLKDSRDQNKKQVCLDLITAYNHVFNLIKNNRIKSKDVQQEQLSQSDIRASSIGLRDDFPKEGIFSTLTESFPLGNLELGILPGGKLPAMTLKPSNITFNPHDEVGVLSEKYESGGRGPGTVSSGKDDPGGISYGTWQLSSNSGTLDAYLKSPQGSVYAKQFGTAKPNSPEFINRWKEIASTDPAGFEKSQHDFLMKNNVDPVFSYAASKGLDVQSKTIQNVLWSQAIQHGLSGNKKIIDWATSNINDLKDIPSTVKALYEARSNYVAKLSMPSSTKQSLLRRYQAEGNDAMAMWQQESQNSKKTNQIAVRNAAISEHSNISVDNSQAENVSANSYKLNVSNTDSKLENLLMMSSVSGALAGQKTAQNFISKDSQNIESLNEKPWFYNFSENP